MKRKMLNILTALFLVACTGGDPAGSATGPEIPKSDIENLQEAVFPFGGALAVNTLKTDTGYRNLALEELSSVTAENALKMYLSTGEGTYDFTDADYIVNWAVSNGKRFHGHVLVWYHIVPWWLEGFSGTKQELTAILERYIKDVVGHFKGKIASWDVVNEAFEDDGSLRKDNLWYRVIGADYIEIAFRAAHEADPDALLFYNDYGQEYSTAKSDAINSMVADFVRRGVPIHGVGLQVHTNLDMDMAKFRYALRTAAATGLQVHVSELDVKTNMSNKPGYVFTNESAEKQREIYRLVTEKYMELSEKQRYGITFWGLTDQYSWLWQYNGSPDRVLPFDENYQRKPAYDGILEGLYEE